MTSGPLSSAATATISTTLSSNALVRLIFREVLNGDRRKFEAQSNDSPTGGGARDFRFRPYDKFDGVFERMLTGKRTELRMRDGVRVPEEIYTASVNVVKNNGTHIVKTIEFEPPTTPRPNEGRLTRLNHYGLDVPSDNEGRIVLILYQTNNSQLWLNFATEAQLISNSWNAQVTELLMGCLMAPRPQTHAAQGFLDVLSGNRFCKSSGVRR